MREKQGSNNYLKLLDKWQKESSSLYGEEAKEVKIFSDSGIPLKPVFGPLDIEGIPYDEIGMPGVYPFTRGIEHLWHKYEPIRAWIFFGFGLPEETRERMELFLNRIWKNFFMKCLLIRCGWRLMHRLHRLLCWHCLLPIPKNEDFLHTSSKVIRAIECLRPLGDFILAFQQREP